MTQTNLSIDTLRRLAYMQHIGEDFCIINDVAYECSEEQLRSDYEDEKQECDTPDTYMSFEDWILEHGAEVEELEADNYSIDYMVLTDEEADEKWDESLDNYLDECVYPELEKIGNLANYFDDDAWKRDARMDGRGHSLSSYDGNENTETVLGETFYIYRTN